MSNSPVIRKGDQVEFKPEYRTANDEGVVFIALEDGYEGQSIQIRSEIGFGIFNPITTTMPYMLTVVEGGK